MRIYIERDGCKRRGAEVSKLGRYFVLNGYEIVDKPEKADYILLATCAFKRTEEENSLSRVEALQGYNAKMIVFGCLPDIAPSRFRQFSEINHVSPKNINNIDSYFDNISIKFSEIEEQDESINEIEPTPLKTAFAKLLREFEFSGETFNKTVRYGKKRVKDVFKNKKSYYLITSRGCLGECSYCAIKYAIGPINSRPLEVVTKEYRKCVEAGYRNFIVAGDDVGAYGIDRNSSFPELVECLLGETSDNGGIGFHIDEIHPRWLIRYHDRFIELLASKRIKSVMCPVQSGNNRILGLMKRNHTAEELLQVIGGIQRTDPAIRLSTQIMVGFPSETDGEFADTLEFMKKARFSSVIIFPYHEKEKTPASKLPDKMPEHVIQRRIKEAQEYLKQENIQYFFNCAHVETI